MIIKGGCRLGLGLKVVTGNVAYGPAVIIGVPQPVGHAVPYVVNLHEAVDFLLDTGEDFVRPLFCKNLLGDLAKQGYIIALQNGREVVFLEINRLP